MVSAPFFHHSTFHFTEFSSNLAFPPFCFFLRHGAEFFVVRVDDMTLESFDGLEMIPREILQQGTKKIASNMRVILVLQRIKENKHATSFK